MGNGIDERLSLLQEDNPEIELPDDVDDIEAFLEGGNPKADAKTETRSETEGTETEDERAAREAAEKAAEEAEKAKVDEESEEARKAKESEESAEEARKKGDGAPPAVLRATRESLHQATALLEERDEELAEARRKNAELETKLAAATSKTATDQANLQAQADQITGTGVKLEAIDKKTLDALKQDLDPDGVRVIETLVDRHNALTERLERLETGSRDIEARYEEIEQREQRLDIDAVPLLAVIEATNSKEADELWKRAVAYERVIKADPDFQGSSRREVYQEVGRRLERHLGDDGVKKWLDGGDGENPEKPDSKTDSKPTRSTETEIDDKLAAARKRAAPTSLSDLPAGAPASQNEMERIEAISDPDLEDLIETALTKGGKDGVSALAEKLLTAE